MTVHRFRAFLESLRDADDGVTMIEYALLAVLIAVAMIAAILLLRTALGSVYGDVAAGFP